MFEAKQKRERGRTRGSKKEKKDDFKETMNMIQCNSCYLNYSKHTPVPFFFLLYCTWTMNRVYFNFKSHNRIFFFKLKQSFCPICSWNLITWHMSTYTLKVFSIRTLYLNFICTADDDDKNHIYANSYVLTMLLSYHIGIVQFFFILGIT